MMWLRHSRSRPSAPAILARGSAMVLGPRLVVRVRGRLPCRYPMRSAPTRCERGAPSASSSSSSMMISMVSRIRSRSCSSSEPFPCPPLLLSLSIASSSGTRLPAGASCGSTRRILTLFHFSTNSPTLPIGSCCLNQLDAAQAKRICRAGLQTEPSEPRRIDPIHGVVVNIGIQVEAAAGVADGIGGHEALEQGVIDSPAELHERRLVGVVEHGGPSRKARFLRVAVIVVAGVDPPERLVGL